MTPLCPKCPGNMTHHAPYCDGARKTTIELPFSPDDVRSGTARPLDYQVSVDPDTLATTVVMPTPEKVARDVQVAIARDHEGKVADALIRLGWTPPHGGLISSHHSDENDITRRITRWRGCWQVGMGDGFTEGSNLPELAATEIERLRVLFRVHMLRFAPNSTHADIDAVLYPSVPEFPEEQGGKE